MELGVFTPTVILYWCWWAGSPLKSGVTGYEFATRCDGPLTPLVSFLYNINTVVLLIVSLQTCLFCYIIICIVIVQVLNKDHQCMNQRDCLLLSSYLQNYPVLFWLGYLIQVMTVPSPNQVNVKAWRNCPTLLVKHHCSRPNSNVRWLSIANDTETNNSFWQVMLASFARPLSTVRSFFQENHTQIDLKIKRKLSLWTGLIGQDKNAIAWWYCHYYFPNDFLPRGPLQHKNVSEDLPTLWR